MDMALVCTAVFWIHVLPDSDVVSSTLSPRDIVIGQTIYFHEHCQIEFGVYVHTHKSGDNSIITNHTSSAIFL